jgi:outer membrane biosynthesis protein TonB
MSHQSDYGLWVGVVLSVIIHLGGGFAWYSFAGQSGPKIKLDAIQAAVLVRKGKPRPKHLLPRIYQPKYRPPPRRRIVQKKKKKRNKKTRRKKKKRRKARRRPIDLDKSLEQRIREYRRRQERDPRAENKPPPGQLNGSLMGTAERARAGSMYGAKVAAKIDQNLSLPSFMTDAQRDQCRRKVRVSMFITRNGSLRSSATKVSGNVSRHCKNAVLNAVKSADPYPAPPRKAFPNGTPITVLLKH